MYKSDDKRLLIDTDILDLFPEITIFESPQSVQ
jgi:hypothetical protein